MWHKPTEKPGIGLYLWILNPDGSIDWIGSRKKVDVSKSKGWMYFDEVCEALKQNTGLLESLKPVRQEILDKHGVLDDTWNDDYHLEITITVAEAKKIIAAIGKAGGK